MANVRSRRPRNIVVLCDGTGKNGQRDSAKGEPITNIWRLYQAIIPQEGDIVEYFPGVGADNAKVSAMDLLAQMFGYTAVVSIREIYMTIAQNYKEGDNISLFGYSRGAFIVRKVASLIGALGLITDKAKFNEHWEGMEHKLPGQRSTPLPLKPRVVPISCLGVWDTLWIVGAVRPRAISEALNLLTLPDDDLPEVVQLALHVVAYHENRKLFDVVLFDADHNDKQLCKQTLFPGSHSDVGGGGIEPKHRRNILPDVTLDWMLRNMPQTIQVAFSGKLESQVPSWYPINSAFHDGPFWKRIPDKLHQREYLPKMYGLFRHRTLLGLPSPSSPHLLKHLWRHWEHFNSTEEEVENGKPASKRSLLRRLTDKAKPSTTSAPRERPMLPPLSPQPPLTSLVFSSTEPQVFERRPLTPDQALRPVSAVTNQTFTPTDTQVTASTPRTSLSSVDFVFEAEPGAREDNGPSAHIPEAPAPKLVRAPQLPTGAPAPPTSQRTERIDPNTERAGPTTSKSMEPVIENSARSRAAAQVLPTTQAGPTAEYHPTTPVYLPAPQVSPAVQPHPVPTQIRPTVQNRPAGLARPAAPVGPRVRPSPAVSPIIQARPSTAQVDPDVQTRPSTTQAYPDVPIDTATQARPAGQVYPPAAAQTRPAIQTYPSVQTRSSTAQLRPTATQVGPAAQVHPSISQAELATPIDPAAQVRPGSAQAYPGVQIGPGVPAGPAPAPAQFYPSVTQLGSAVPTGRAPAQTGLAPVDVSFPSPAACFPVTRADLALPIRDPVQFPLVLAQPSPITAVDPAVQAHPATRVYAAQVHPSIPQVQLATPIDPAAQVRPGSAQAYPGVQIGPGVPAGPAPAPAQFYPSVTQLGSAVPTKRASAQTGLTPVDASFLSPTHAGGCSPVTRADLSLAIRPPVQFPLVLAQASPVTAVDPAVQAHPATRVYPSANQASPAAQAYTVPVGPTVRPRPAAQVYSPAIQARLAAVQTRAPVEAHPAAQFRPAAAQAYRTTTQTDPTATRTYPLAPVGPTFDVHPNRPRQKKGVMQKILAFFCCGSSNQTIG